MKTSYRIIITLLVLVAAGATQELAPTQERRAVPDAPSHAFFDRYNVALFSAVATVRTLDMHSTWRFRARGWQELQLSNEFVDNRPAFTAYSMGSVAASVGASYLLHRTGHHRMERVVSVVHVVYVGKLVVKNYGLKR